MKQTLNVNIENENNHKYCINISDDNLSDFFENIKSKLSGKKCLFVISKKVYKLYKEILNLPVESSLILNDGESEKNFKTYLKILDKAEKIGLTRKDAIVAIGGGVIGDIAGFAASTYMRGIDYIQVPTTLLSMVDSSVGGKTAIDMNGVKNIIGTFYQPREVFININFIKTLDKKQFLSGLGEILKYAFIEDNCGYKHSLFLFEYLTLGCEKILEKEPMTLMRVIEYCLNLKIAVVNQDEKEAGLRKVLNFGHTLAHALESITNYRKYTHGEAVIQGMFFVLNWAYSQNKISYSYYRTSVELLNKYGFRSEDISKKYNISKLVNIMKKDKKANSEKITFILPLDKKKVEIAELDENEVIKMF